MCILYWNSLIYSGNTQLGHNSSKCLGHSLSLSQHKSRQNTSTMQYIVLLKDNYLTIINQPNILLQTYKSHRNTICKRPQQEGFTYIFGREDLCFDRTDAKFTLRRRNISAGVSSNK